MSVIAPNLVERPPRSPRVRLGGYVLLPRILDKCRAVLADQAGDFKYGCPADQRFLGFVRVDPEALKAEVARGRSDAEMLAWINANAAHRPSPEEVAAWSGSQEARVPDDDDSRAFFQELHAQIAPHRTDVVTWFDLLDLDDFASFGGQP